MHLAESVHHKKGALMNPTPAKQATSARKVQRRVMCQDYGTCLDKALQRGWPGFTCSACKDYCTEDLDNASYWQVQAERSGAILKRIFVDKPPLYGLVGWRRHPIAQRKYAHPGGIAKDDG